MRRNLTFAFAILAILLSMGACRSLNQITPAELDDEAIEAEVRAKIAEEDAGETFSIGVAVDNGVVTLTGSVPNNDERRRIAAAAGDVEGVRSVINNIRVRG